MKPNQKLIKASAATVASLILLLVFGIGVLSLGESYNPFDPYADTEFGEAYSPDKFEQVKVGMAANQVREIVGKPLHQYTDTLTDLSVKTKYSYTNDGFLMKRPDKKYALVGDLAWYMSVVTFNADSIVTDVNSGWLDD